MTVTFSDREQAALIALKRRLMSQRRIPRPTSMVLPTVPVRSPWAVPQPKEQRND